MFVIGVLKLPIWKRLQDKLRKVIALYLCFYCWKGVSLSLFGPSFWTTKNRQSWREGVIWALFWGSSAHAEHKECILCENGRLKEFLPLDWNKLSPRQVSMPSNPTNYKSKQPWSSVPTHHPTSRTATTWPPDVVLVHLHEDGVDISNRSTLGFSISTPMCQRRVTWANKFWLCQNNFGPWEQHCPSGSWLLPHRHHPTPEKVITSAAKTGRTFPPVYPWTTLQLKPAWPKSGTWFSSFKSMLPLLSKSNFLKAFHTISSWQNAIERVGEALAWSHQPRTQVTIKSQAHQNSWPSIFSKLHLP